MAKRGGLSISVKMILTTTFLILLTVLGFGALNAAGKTEKNIVCEQEWEKVSEKTVSLRNNRPQFDISETFFKQ